MVVNNNILSFRWFVTMHKKGVINLDNSNKITSIDFQALDSLLEVKLWSYSDLAKKLGTYRTRISEMKRGKHLLSYEDSAKMCVYLNASPFDLFPVNVEAEKIASLIEAQKIIPAGVGEEMSLVRKTAIELVNSLTDEQLRKLIPVLEAAKNIK